MGRIDPFYYNVFIATIALCVVIGLFLGNRLRKETEEDDSPTTEGDLLRDIERAYYAGSMNKEEFEKAKALVPGKLPPAPQRGPSAKPARTINRGEDILPPPSAG